MHNIGIIGYGAFGRFLKQSWESLETSRVSFITKTKPETARRMAEEDGVPKYSSDYKDLISDPDVDIVVIATPPYMHEQMAVEALRAGKNVLVEKPLAMNPQQASNIIQAAEESVRVGAVNFIMRYSGLMDKLHTVCREGLLGKLRRVIVENYASDEGLGSDHWFWDRSKSGGIFVEHGVHFFDLAGWLANGSPSRVTGSATERESGIQDKVLSSVEYDNGVMGTFYHSFSRPSALESTTSTYVFDRGQVDVFGWIPMELRLKGFVSAPELHRLSELFKGAIRQIDPLTVNSVRSSGVEYEVSTAFGLYYIHSDDKQAQYAQCVSDLMSDLIAAIDDPSHEMRVSLEDGLRATEIACASVGSADVYPTGNPG